jgi:hypothetical protein
MGKEILWKGEKDHNIVLSRPCPCGCDRRYGNHGVGYLTGSLNDGEGFTIWIRKEAMYERLRFFYCELNHINCIEGK